MKVGPKKTKPTPKPLPMPERKWWIITTVGKPVAQWGTKEEVRAVAERLKGKVRDIDPKDKKHLQLVELEMLRWCDRDATRPIYTFRLDAVAQAERMGVVLKPGAPCKSKGCPNRKNQGTFVGDLCFACHTRLSRAPVIAPTPPKKKAKR